MNYMFGDDEDYQDDNESGGRRKKLFSKIRRRMSIVKSNRKDDDEEEDEESTRNDDDEQHGFLKRKMQKRQEQKDLRKQQQKERQEKPTGAKSKEKPVHKEVRRMSLHRGMPRLGASRALRMSISRPPPREDEEDDVAMPLPGHAHEDAPDLAELLTPPGDDKDADGKKRRSFLKGLSKKSSNGAASQSNSSTGGKRGKSSGSSTSSRKSKRRGKTKLASSDRSVDSPPSVASTESSIDNGGGKGGAAQHHAPRREQSTKRRSGLGPFGKPKNGDDDDAGGDADCASLNNQAIPWIIKTWIYFVTVVVPFTILYYCFAGICHSSALQETPILKKVYFANMLFNGLGCTYRTGFWARQALDAKGVYAESPNAQRSGEMISSPPPAAAAAAPLSPRVSTISRKLPIRNRSGNQGRLGGFMGSTPVPRNASTSLPRSTRRSVGTSFSPVRQMSSRLSPSQSSDTIRPHMRGSTMGIQRSQLSNVRSTATDNGGLVKKSARNEQARSRSAMEGKSSSHIIKSVWDVEHLIPISKKSSAPKARPSMDKHMSILEIYDVHATDERVGLLQ